MLVTALFERDQLIDENLDYALRLAARMAQRLPRSVDVEELYFCRSESSAQILVRLAADTHLFPGKVIVICQPAAGWPWKLGTQERMMTRLGAMLESHGAVPFRDAV